jgi:hypothetical protein
MNKNMGSADRIIRIIIALVVGLLFYFETISGALGYGLVIVAAIFLLTSFVSFCPIYFIFGIRSCPVKK